MKEGISGTEGPPQDFVPKYRGLGGLFVRKTRWGLSHRAKLLLLIVVLALAVTALLGVYPFLAITERVDADALVVEGWVHPYAIRVSVDEFSAHPYQWVFTTGGPVVGNGGYVNDYQTSASVGAELLKKAGVPAELVKMVPSHVIGRDRTYSSAIALREWFKGHNLQVQGSQCRDRRCSCASNSPFVRTERSVRMLRLASSQCAIQTTMRSIGGATARAWSEWSKKALPTFTRSSFSTQNPQPEASLNNDQMQMRPTAQFRFSSFLNFFWIWG